MNDVLNDTWRQAKKQAGRKLDLIKIYEVCKKELFSFRLLIIYVLCSYVFYLTTASVNLEMDVIVHQVQ